MVVNAIVDTLKTAFPRSEPQSPTEELSEAETESKPQTEGKKAGKWEALQSPRDSCPVLRLIPNPQPKPIPNSQALEEKRWAIHTSFYAQLDLELLSAQLKGAWDSA